MVWTGGAVEETYNPHILTGQQLASAILTRQHFTRLYPIPGTRLISLRDPCGQRGINPHGLYLIAHNCLTTSQLVQGRTP